MKFFNDKGTISYELIGKFISDLQKDNWLDFDELLENSENSLKEILPALDFFYKTGHIDLNLEKGQIMAYSKRKNGLRKSIFEPKRRFEVLKSYFV